MLITFFGAAQNVTGSKHLIQSQGYNLLLDCGLYQGKRKNSNELNKNLPFAADQINAVYFNKHVKNSGDRIFPIYTKEDAERTLNHFQEIPYFSFSGQWTPLNENMRFKFYDAGHVLGSAITLLETKESGIVKTLAFSGDLGRKYLPILRSPENIEEDVQSMIMECTYGNRIHRPFADLAGQLKGIINGAFARKSKLIVPAFSQIYGVF